MTIASGLWRTPIQHYVPSDSLSLAAMNKTPGAGSYTQILILLLAFCSHVGQILPFATRCGLT